MNAQSPSYEELKRQNEELTDRLRELEKQREIWETSGLMQAILDNIQDGICVLNPDLTIRYVNPVMEKWYSQNMPLIGKKCFACYHNRQTACDPCPTLRAMQSGKTEMNEIPGPDDPESWLELYSYPLKDRNTGKLTGIIEFVRDISERKRAEKIMYQSRERYQILFDNSPFPLWEEDFTGVYEYLNEIKRRGITDFRNYFEENPQEVRICKEKIKYSDINKATLNLFEARSRDEFFNNLDKIINEGFFHVFSEEIIRLAGGEKEFSSEMKIETLKGKTKYIELNLIIEDSNPELVRGLVATPEITERILMDQKLRESETRFRLAFQTSPDAISLTRLRDGKYIDINHGFTNITGYTPEETLGKTSADLKIWNDPQERELLLHKLNSKGIVINHEAGFRLKGGVIIAGLMSAAIMTIGDENVLLSITKDITALKNIQKELSVNEQTLQLALEGGGLGTWDWNIRTGKVKFNQQWATMLGYELDEVEGTLDFWKSLIHPDDADEVMKTLQNHLDGETEYYEHEFRMLTRQRSWKWIYDRGKVLEWDSEDRPLRALGTHLDITARKLSEEKTAKLSRAVENSPVSIVITDNTGKIEYVNPQFSQLTGYSFEEVIGKNSSILQSGRHSKEFYENLWSTITSGQVWFGEFLNKKKDGSTYWEKANISSISDNTGKLTHYVAVKEDVTQMKNMVEDLHKAKEQAEESDRLKSAFLANMSHEIRTPMNGIMGFSSLLRESISSDDKRSEYLNIIEKSGARMLNLINDLIDISRIEAGEIEIFNSSVNLNELLKELYDFFSPEIRQKGINFLLKNSLHEKNINFIVDREKLYAVLANLIKNAVKYSDRGNIEFGCRIYKQDLSFYVKDSGIGIPLEKQEEVFNRFIQADQHINKAYEGSGLGLAISKAYIEMMGGEIWLESLVGKGTIFYFTVPCTRKYEKAAQKVFTGKDQGFDPGLENLFVIIADDDENSKMYLKEILIENCKKVLLTSNGIETVQVVKNNPDIDIVLMDIKMPEMDGYEATRRIREFNNEIIIIAQTAYALRGEEEKAKMAGCNDFITKPIDKRDLLKILKSYS